MNNAGTEFNRFQKDPAYQRGFEDGGRILGQGAMVLGRYGCTVSTAPYDPESEIESAMEQESDLEKWARANGHWYENPHSYYGSMGYSFYGYGGEAQVYAEGDRYVHKICRTGQYDNLIQFIDRIVIQNTICPAAALEVEGFGRDARRDFVFLLKQRFFRQEYTMEESEITDFMENLGFQKLVEKPYNIIKYYSDSVIAGDLHSGNIWKTEKSNVVIIDASFRFNYPGLGLGGKFMFQ